MLLEKLLNQTIALYKTHNVGIFHKKLVPVRPQLIRKEGDQLRVHGYIPEKSTTDYYGIYEGIFVAIEAKSTNEKNLPRQNVKSHQQQYLDLINDHKGLGAYIVYFKRTSHFYFLHANKLRDNPGNSWGEPFFIKNGYVLELEYPGILDFIKIIREYI